MTTPSDSGTFEFLEATVAEIHSAMEAGETTTRELVDRALDRIEAYDAELNAILTVNDDARDRAAELDTHFDSEGLIGPLHGIPTILKDNQDTHDMPTTAGAQALAESRPTKDAHIVKRLRDAGAVIVAKANLQELSFGVDTISSLGGETRNAYALDHRPSGSSGGTAAAIAANLATVGTGSDTCSSVRSPPAFNNLVGVRPTRGLVSRTGIVPLSETQDTAGPITRTVADAARMLDVIAGYDEADPITATGADRIPSEGYVPYTDPDGLTDARIGIVRELFGVQDSENSAVDPTAAREVTSVLETAIEDMETAGATIVDPVSIVDRNTLDAARVLEYEWKRDFDRYLAGLGDTAPVDSLEALVETGTVADPIEERIREAGVLEPDVETLGQNVGYLRSLHRRERIRVDTIRRLVEDDLDALLYPPSTVPPVKLPEHQPFSELPCELAAHSGLPSIVLPAGFTGAGLPVGVELLGRPFAEPRLFELAAGFEAATEHRTPPDRFGPLA